MDDNPKHGKGEWHDGREQQTLRFDPGCSLQLKHGLEFGVSCEEVPLLFVPQFDCLSRTHNGRKDQQRCQEGDKRKKCGRKPMMPGKAASA